MPPLIEPGAHLAQAVVSAHPGGTTQHVGVPIGIVVLAAVTVVVVATVAVPAREDTATDARADQLTASWWGELSWGQWVARSVSLFGLLLAVAAGRVGVDDELENLAPALVVGAGLPLMVAGCLVVGRLWRWVDPWDGLARLVAPGDRSRAPGHVWPAVGLVLPWLWFLAVHPQPLDPRAVGLAVGAYTVLTVAGCVALGRVRWLSSSEPVGLLLSWVGLVPRLRVTGWRPPAGAAALLGVMVGGLLFGALRRTELWGPVAALPHATLYATGGLLAASAVGGTTAVLAERIGSPEQGVVVARALVPVVAGVVLAVSLARNRLSTSLQLLPGLVGDPLGLGWDLLGSPTSGLDAAPLGAVGLVVVQLMVVGLAHLLSAVAVPRVLVGDERLPVIVLLAISVAAGMATFSLH